MRLVVPLFRFCLFGLFLIYSHEKIHGREIQRLVVQTKEI